MSKSKKKNFSYLSLKKKVGLFYLQLHITPNCNLRCKHCYEDFTATNYDDLLKSKEIFKIIDEFSDFLDIIDMRGKIYFTGGEPILDPNLLRYIAKASNLNLITMLLSNGTLIDDLKARELRDVGTNIVQISLDGLEDTHDFIRGNGNFKKATLGLDNCNNVGINTTVMTTLSRLNASEIEGLIQHCIKHNVNRISFGRLVPTGNGAHLFDQLLTNQELLHLFKKLKRLRKKYKNSIFFAFHDPIWTTFLKIKNTHGCSAGISGICIIENGDIMPCRRLDLPIGNIRENSLIEIWNTRYLRHFRKRDNFQGKCKNCKHLKRCGGCRAIAKALHKSEFSEDPQCFLIK
ncbi:MAG: radical SAM protein [Promethearchaeota archaeon]